MSDARALFSCYRKYAYEHGLDFVAHVQEGAAQLGAATIIGVTTTGYRVRLQLGVGYYWVWLQLGMGYYWVRLQPVDFIE